VKLLLYSHYFAPSIGGVETIVLSLARGLAERRTPEGAREFEVTVATQTPREEFDDSQLPFPVVRGPSFWQLMRLVRASDVLHVAGPSFAPLVMGLLAWKPVVIEHHAYQAICPNGLLIHQPERSVCPGHFQAQAYSKCLRCRSSELSRLRSFISLFAAFPRKALVWRATANIAITEHVRQRLAAPRTSVVYYGIDPISKIEGSSFPPVEAFRRIRFAYVGRFVQEKGIPVLLSAVAELRKQGLDFEVVLIGDGPERSKIEARLDAENLRSVVSITGSLSGTALTEAVSDVQVVIMPSVWEETAGLSAMEQMTRGRLVVCSDIGGLSEIVGDTGLKFPAGNATMLAECLRSVIENPALIDKLGSLARTRASGLFLRSRMIEGHKTIYRELVQK
jgi:glycogen(starch) synthase